LTNSVSKFLPAIAVSGFSHLRSLSIVWDTTSIADEALELISTLTSLEQIQLGAGWYENIYRFHWLIDHEQLRANLGPLQSLKRISFIRDTYRTSFPLPISPPIDDIEYYYTRKYPDLREYQDPQEMRRALFADNSHEDVFERQHKARMVDEASNYIKVFPQLEVTFPSSLTLRFILSHLV